MHLIVFRVQGQSSPARWPCKTQELQEGHRQQQHQQHRQPQTALTGTPDWAEWADLGRPLDRVQSLGLDTLDTLDTQPGLRHTIPHATCGSMDKPWLGSGVVCTQCYGLSL